MINYALIMQKNVKELPWIEKYRPQSFDEIVDHDDKINTLKALIDSGQLTHLLLTGPPGTGKTSLVINMARYLYGPTYKNYITDINSSSDRGIDTVRDRISTFIQSRSNKVKLVILDEADALTTEAQNALKSVIEKYSSYARFCLICNDENKITPALHSRCTKLVFTHLSRDSIITRVKDIVRREDMMITDEAIVSLVSMETDLRQILNILQGLNSYYEGTTVDSSHVYKYLGKPSEEDVANVINSLLNDSLEVAIAKISEMQDTGSIKMLDLVRKLTETVLLLQLDPKYKGLIFMALSDIETKLLQGCSEKILICLLASVFLKIRDDVSQ